jgi:uncharacterized membrane protein YkvA (DUF1232 family)
VKELEMQDFFDKLVADIDQYEGRHDEFIYLTPYWYRLMTNLLDDPRLPRRLKPLISCAIAYFIMPADIISEEIHGPYGYIDDIFFCAYVANQVLMRTEKAELLAENWEGEGDIIQLVEEILEQESSLIGDQKELILQYTGCTELLECLERKS